MISNYPRLYHMASEGSWPSIEKYGLQCTRALLERYEVESEQTNLLLKQHRPELIKISNKKYQDAILRDQKPMSNNGLLKALGGSCTPSEWYEILNNKVFFWLTKERLAVMLGARPYRKSKHDIITIESKKLIEDYADKILLSRMNSGNTKPFAHERTPELFQKISDFPFEKRRKTRSLKDTVVELTVPEGVSNISDYVLDVQTISIDEL